MIFYVQISRIERRAKVDGNFALSRVRQLSTDRSGLYWDLAANCFPYFDSGVRCDSYDGGEEDAAARAAPPAGDVSRGLVRDEIVQIFAQRIGRIGDIN